LEFKACFKNRGAAERHSSVHVSLNLELRKEYFKGRAEVADAELGQRNGKEF